MNANTMLRAIFILLACLSRAVSGVDDERIGFRQKPLESVVDKRSAPDARAITATTEKTTQTKTIEKNTLCVLGDEKGDASHMRLLMDQTEKNGHHVKKFQSVKAAVRGLSECSAVFAFQRGDVENRMRNAIARMDADVRVNHIEGTDALTSKKELMELGLEFVPERRREGNGGDVPMMRKKPTHGGTEVILRVDDERNGTSALKSSEYIYQRYIDNALRIDGMPFDYGVYVFLSETPSDDQKKKEGKLTYEVWNDVMLRFATNGKYVESTYTNAWSMPSLVNASSSEEEKYFQAKTALARYLGEEKSKALFETIDRRVEDAFRAARPYLSNTFTTSAFSLLRFDFVIDDKMYPWLIEVNASPNIKPSSKGQEKMLVEMLDVVSKKLFAPEKDITLSHELTRETDISKRRKARMLAQSEYTDTDCVVSAWSAYMPETCADPCYATTHTQVRTRSITTDKRGNGAECPHLIESRVANCPNECPAPSQPSPPPAPPPPSPSPPPQWNYTYENGDLIVFTSSSSIRMKSSLERLVFVVAVACLLVSVL